LIGNPTTVTGAFRRAFYEERQLYHNITISALDSPNVQAGKTVVPGLTSARWVEERRETWGEDNPIYRARVLGEFPDQAEDTLIGLSDVEAAAQRWKAEKEGVAGETEGETIDIPGEVVLAVDVARFGSDRSVILRRQGSRVLEIRTFRDMDTMQLAGWVAAAIRETSPERVCVDEIGVGAGVVDRLKEQGHPVKGINVARRARQERLFANVRAEGYWRLKELFATGEISIPDDHQLMGELAALRYSFDSQGRVLMESKEAMRQRGLPSPDKADALMLAFLESANKTRLWT
ncbi:MAG: hypothetical protein J4N69_09710, partial [Chloroflexi bacterium]|nr:hypothetical protein [Chloroflexota bacterium]